MSNVHQLVKELAIYEQQRKDLERDLSLLDDKYDIDSENSIDGIEYESITNEYMNRVKPLEEQLNKIYEHIDFLEAEIDTESNNSYGYDDDEY
jgi:chromosome segregation ATPase